MAGVIEAIAEHPFAFMALSVVMLLLMVIAAGTVVAIVKAFTPETGKGDIHEWHRQPTRRVD